MSSRQNISKSVAIGLVVAIASFCGASPAQAQNWTYSPYTGSATWLSVARTLSYPLNRLSSVGVPLYWANGLIRGGAYAVDQRLRNPRQQGMNAYAQQPSVADQMVHARWKDQQLQQQAQYQDQGEQFDAVPVMTPPAQEWSGPAPVVATAPAAVPVSSSDVMPPVAPAAPKNVPSGAGRPLAAGLVHVINDRFGGDIAAALSDKDTCKYARAVGLIDSNKFDADKISLAKKDLIRAILADNNEPADIKINAVRVLLKH